MKRITHLFILGTLLMTVSFSNLARAAYFQGLGDLPGGSTESYAYGRVSADGSTVVGYSDSASGPEAFRWTSGGGMVGLGHLAGGSFDSVAKDVSADGSIVVGMSSGLGTEAFVWDAAHGMQRLHDRLQRLGVDLSGWTLESVTGISADGLTLVGWGTNPDGNTEAWIADLAPSAIPRANRERR